MEHIKIEIKGKFNQYAVITAEQGYCFYDVNEEQRNYIDQIFMPIVDVAQLEKNYAVVQGNADELNKKLIVAEEVAND